MKYLTGLLVTLLAAVLLTTLVIAQSGYHPIPQTPALMYNEAQMIYLSNLARAGNGVPPMRFNAQLNNAARWFAWDSVANRPPGFCDHRDTFGNYPDSRALAFGYLGFSGAEDAFCGYVTPEEAVAGWMESEPHRRNLLDPVTREAGAGYYRRASDGRGFVALAFGSDAAYAPLVIENEALFTLSPEVKLYLYDREVRDDFIGSGPAVEMQISNDACFTGAEWQPYTPGVEWSLGQGAEGWRTVYARTRDGLGRVLSASDMIFYGSDFSAEMITSEQLSTTRADAPLVGLDSGGLPLMQFSQNWIADDSTRSFELLNGSGQHVADPAAWGGTAFRFDSTDGSAWLWTSDFYKGKPMTAYLRLKVDSNRSGAEAVRFSITGGKTIRLKGTDFAVAGEYQEFALDFTFPEKEKFLILDLTRSGDTAVYFDAVTFFSAPVAFRSEYHLPVEGGNYRGQGIWVRYTGGEGQFTPFQPAQTAKPGLVVQPREVRLLVARDHSVPEIAILRVIYTCMPSGVHVKSGAAWLQAAAVGDEIQLRVLTEMMEDGDYSTQVDVVPDNGSPAVVIPVSVRVIGHAYPLYLPLSR